MKNDAIQALVELLRTCHRWRVTQPRATSFDAVNARAELAKAIAKANVMNVEGFLAALRTALDEAQEEIDGDTHDLDHPGRFIPPDEWRALELALAGGRRETQETTS